MGATATETPVKRDGSGRFQPGQSGNPAGKKPGTRNHATVLRELLDEGADKLAGEVLMAQLHGQSAVAARFVLERMHPKLKPSDRCIDLGLPEDASPADMLQRVLAMMAAGEVTIDEASRFAALIERYGGLVERAAARAGAAKDADAPAAEASSPAFSLHLQADGAAQEPSEPSGGPPRPLNRHERRRLAALGRATPAPMPPPDPLTTAAWAVPPRRLHSGEGGAI